MKQKKPIAVILCSGGLDSTTVMAIARNKGYQLFALSIQYNQRHSCEIESSKKVAKFFSVKKHLILNINLSKIGGSSLTNNIPIPQNRVLLTGIPSTYVPARNTIFLSLALAWAEVLNSFDIFIGANSVDYSGYPDCRINFIKSFEDLANIATRAAIQKKGVFKIHAPLLHMSKAQIIKKGVEFKVDYSITHSCYNPVNGVSCGVCDSCILRLNGFKDAGLDDPIKYKGEI